MKLYIVSIFISLLFFGCSANNIVSNDTTVEHPKFTPRTDTVELFNTYQVHLKDKVLNQELNKTIEELSKVCKNSYYDETLTQVVDKNVKSLELSGFYKDKLKKISLSHDGENCRNFFDTVHECTSDDNIDEEEKNGCFQLLERVKVDLILLNTPQEIEVHTEQIDEEKNKNGTIKTLYYGTNRKANQNNPSLGYSGRKVDKLSLGVCKVFIPREHRYGHIDGTLWEKIIHFDRSYGKIKRKEIIHYKDKARFWKELRDKLALSSTKEALIFIHGYNNSFDDAAIRTAQISFDLGFQGATAFFSWPSRDRALKYIHDEATIQASEKYIKEFLIDFVKKSDAKTIHLIAHSMGNRGLLRVISDIEKEAKDIKFGQIILSAPDVDTDLFKHIAKAYQDISKKTTLYISPKDKAMKFSKKLHGSARVGYAGPICVVDGIETVEVDLHTDPLGHGYFAKEKNLLEDMRALLKNEKRKEYITLRNRENKEYKLIDVR